MMYQTGLFDPPPEVPFRDPFGDDDWDHLRWYQQEAATAIESGWTSYRSQLLVFATGLGKTEVFCTVARDTDGPVLVLAHRDELVEQAAKRLEKIAGDYVEIEKADMTASARAKYVVGSVQSFTPKRLERMGKHRFSLVIADEAHRYVAPTYRRALDFFDARILGVTATPDRRDELALGQVFEDVSYVMDIMEGIEAGYLVPLRGRLINLAEVDLSEVKTGIDGDLQEGQLDQVMRQAVHGIVEETLRLEPDRPAVCFMPGVLGAEYLSNAFNAKKPNSAAFVCGATPPLERKRIARDFKEGRIQYYCNCNVAVEGFDAPQASLIVQGRPTTSRALAAQMVGRGTRVLPGVVDAIGGRLGASARRSAVASSAKPDCMILDFVGNAGKHSLMTPEDILGGSYTPAEVAEAKRQAKNEPGGDVATYLRQAREALKRLAERTKAKVVAQVVDFNPFSVFQMDRSDDDNRHVARWGSRKPTERQLESLRRRKVPEADLKNLNARDASRLLDEMNRRWADGLATYAQLRRLQQYGIGDTEVRFDRASAAMNYISSKGWKAELVDSKVLNSIIYADRQPGQEG